MPALKFGITLPYGNARTVATMAQMAEEAGWEGIFVGDAIWCVDPIIQLTAAAMVTSRIRLGTLVLAVPLRIPWHLASESAALDNLSGGRLTLGLGMGATWMGWHAFPDVPMDKKTRAERLDETIDILTLLYQRKQFDFNGEQYHLKLTTMDVMHYPPVPAQQPRIPLWVVGVKEKKKSMERILKCDGLLPAKMNSAGQFEEITPEDVHSMKAYIDANRALATPFDIVIEGKTGGMDRQQQQDTLCPWVEAGATWWIESMWGVPEDQLMERIKQSPPQFE